MNDKPIIVIGLCIALVVLVSPFWYSLAAGRPAQAPTPQLPSGNCVEQNMRARHMELLVQWRDAVVREGQNMYDSTDYPGESYEMSLTKTCLMQCHAVADAAPALAPGGSAPTIRQRFCQQCHNYADVRPNCWDCHLEGSEQ